MIIVVPRSVLLNDLDRSSCAQSSSVNLVIVLGSPPVVALLTLLVRRQLPLLQYILRFMLVLFRAAAHFVWRHVPISILIWHMQVTNNLLLHLGLCIWMRLSKFRSAVSKPHATVLAAAIEC